MGRAWERVCRGRGEVAVRWRSTRGLGALYRCVRAAWIAIARASGPTCGLSEERCREAARGADAFRSPLRSRKGYFSADSIVVESAVSVL